LIDVLFSIIVVLFSFDGEDWSVSDPISINFLNQGHPFCESIIACSFIDEGQVFINIKKLDERDNCDRSPIIHEILHHVYDPKGIEVHGNCTLTTPLILLPRIF